MDIFNIETLGGAMRPENHPTSGWPTSQHVPQQEAFRLSREERDHIAGHALNSVEREAEDLANAVTLQGGDPSTNARKITALSNLLGDIGWERSEAQPLGP